MKYLKLLAITILLNTQCFGQWKQLNSGTNNWLNNIKCLDSNTCFAVGWNGTVLKTIDGGQSWMLKNNGIDISQSYYSISCPSNKVFYLGQGNGEIYKTINGGDLWTATNPPVGFGNSKLFFVNDSIGYACGNEYLKTVNGGATWSWESTYLSNGGFSGICFLNKDIGFLGSGTGEILKTTNGGIKWNYSVKGICSINDIVFVNDSIGYAVGYSGCIYKTVNQGNTWSQLNSNFTNELKAISCANQDTCYAVGIAGMILKTTNGGNTWIRDTAGVPKNNLFSVSFPSPNVGYAVGTVGFILKIDKTTSVEESTTILPQAFIYPNPFTDKAIIYYLPSQQTYHQALNIALYNVLGEHLASYPLTIGSNILERNNFPSGIYIYHILSYENILLTGKLIIY